MSKTNKIKKIDNELKVLDDEMPLNRSKINEPNCNTLKFSITGRIS